MSARTLVANALSTFLSQFPQFSVDAKHSKAWRDYGYKDQIDFADYWSMYERNGIAKAMANRHIEKTWQTFPSISLDDDPHALTDAEKRIQAMTERLDLWNRLMGADRRNRIGRYAGLILMIDDGKRLAEPVSLTGQNPDRLRRVIPVYESQLKPTRWNTKPADPDYGQPTLYQFQEREVGSNMTYGEPARVVDVHPDRVFIWAEGADDDSIYGTPALRAGFNALVTLEKLVGAGGEGFWKMARQAVSMNVNPEANLQQLAQMLGAKDETEIGAKLDEVVQEFNTGLDASLITQGIETKTLDMSLPSPEHFYAIALQEASASVSCPTKVLVGNQTGERASSEDNDEWNQTIMARREQFVVPSVKHFFGHLNRIGLFPEETISLEWQDLTAPNLEKRLANMDKAMDANRKAVGTGEPPPLSTEEVRELGGFEAERPDEFGETTEDDLDG